MPVMETDLEDPDYLPSHWHSAVADIINKIENSTGANHVVGEVVAGSPAVVVSAPNSTTTVPVPSSGGSKIITPSGHHGTGISDTAHSAGDVSLGMSAGGRAADGTRPPAEPLPKSSPSPSSTIVVPVIVPYLVPGSAVPGPAAASPPALPPSPAPSPTAGQLVGYCLITLILL